VHGSLCSDGITACCSTAQRAETLSPFNLVGMRKDELLIALAFVRGRESSETMAKVHLEITGGI
jgi:hypothetical protein